MSFFSQRGISTFWGISIILMEAVVVFFVFYILYFFWIENPTPTSNILIIRAFRGNVISIPASVDTTGWNTYTSVTDDITFKYPAAFGQVVDDIAYGTYEGTVVDLSDSNKAPVFTLKAFSLLPEERGNGASIGEVFTRLTELNPNIYQSYTEEIGSQPAIVYRQIPGDTPQDYIYFMNGTHFFESVFDRTAASILSTVEFSN
jgi:hypothetical protein